MASIINGDALTTLKTLPAQSVQLCVTSPPYFRLREYGNAGQIGLEETPEEYIGKLVSVFSEVKRVLKKDGTLFIVIGDTYNGSGRCAGSTYKEHEKQYTNPHAKKAGALNVSGYKPKDMIAVSWMLGLALQRAGYWLRQELIWAKPSVMPSGTRDRFCTNHERILFLSKSRNYYFNYDAALEPAKYDGRNDTLMKDGVKYEGIEGLEYHNQGHERWQRGEAGEYLRMRRTVWEVNKQAFAGAHFAVYPVELIRPIIKICSRKGDVVIDPFMGSGTTCLVANQEGRDFIGIDINAEYVSMARERIIDNPVQEKLFE